MSKHDTIERNLIAVSRARSVAGGLRGWEVDSLIQGGSKWVSCELCGTRFHDGAWITRATPKIEIAIGWKCLEFIRSRGITPAAIRESRARSKMVLTRSYGTLIDPGSWIVWIVKNAPRELASAAADLKIFGATQSEVALKRLIRFHDRTRLFPIEVLLGLAPNRLSNRGARLEGYVTLAQARAMSSGDWVRQIERWLPVNARQLMKTAILPAIARDLDAVSATRWISATGRLALAAINLAARGRFEDEPICSQDIFQKWPSINLETLRVAGPEVWVWNPGVGLALLDYREITSATAGRVWLWPTGERRTLSLPFLRTVETSSRDAVRELLSSIGRGARKRFRPKSKAGS